MKFSRPPETAHVWSTRPLLLFSSFSERKLGAYSKNHESEEGARAAWRPSGRAPATAAAPRASAKGTCGPARGPAQRTHLPQLEEQPRVVPAGDLVQQVVHQFPAVAPSVLHELLQAGRAGRGHVTRTPRAAAPCSSHRRRWSWAQCPPLSRGPAHGPDREQHTSRTQFRGGLGSLHQTFKVAHDPKRLKTPQRKISEHGEQLCTRIRRTLNCAGHGARAPPLNSAQELPSPGSPGAAGCGRGRGRARTPASCAPRPHSHNEAKGREGRTTRERESGSRCRTRGRRGNAPRGRDSHNPAPLQGPPGVLRCFRGRSITSSLSLFGFKNLSRLRRGAHSGEGQAWEEVPARTAWSSFGCFGPVNAEENK